MYRIGVDLGGTNISVGVVDADFNIIGRGKMKTNAPRPAEEIFADIAKAIELAVDDAGITMDQISVIGVGTPGSVNDETGYIDYSNNLKFDINNFAIDPLLKYPQMIGSCIIPIEHGALVIVRFGQGIDLVLRILPSQTQPSQSIHILFARRKNNFMTIDS